MYYNNFIRDLRAGQRMRLVAEIHLIYFNLQKSRGIAKF